MPPTSHLSSVGALEAYPGGGDSVLRTLAILAGGGSGERARAFLRPLWGARPFRRGDGYLGTELLRCSGGSRECLTLDRWASCAAHEAFRARWNSGCRRLGHRLEELDEEEARLGTFEALPLRVRLACQDTV